MPATPLRHARLALLWATTAAACLGWVKATSIGPVVAVIDARRGWGVHTGDAWALLAAAAAAVVSFRLRGRPRR